MRTIIKMRRNLFLALLLSIVLLPLAFFILQAKEDTTGVSPWRFISREYLNNRGSQQNFILGGSPKVVELTDSGFNPSEITIRLGDTVRFVNKSNRPFWPASNLHPSHEIYPEFDPKKPIPSGQSWSFKFDKEGEWKYHDHLSPINKGIVRIVQANGNSTSSEWSGCEKLSNEPAKQKCWQAVLEQELKVKGLDAGFTLFKQIYSLDPSDCHQYAHSLGEVAYRYYMSSKKISLSEETDYCDFGFWHGFMGALMKGNQGDPKKAGDFCEYIEHQPTSSNATAIGRNCYHGLGIGLIEDPPDPKTWGNAKAMRVLALTTCERITSQDPDKLGNCYSGVFHATIDFMLTRKYELSFDNSDPFKTCVIELSKHHEQCYLQIASKLYSSANGDFRKIADFIKQLPETDVALKKRITQLALHNVLNQNLTIEQFDKLLLACKDILRIDSQDCIDGIVRGLIQTGEPGNEYAKVLHLCTSEPLSQKDKKACLESIVKFILKNATYDRLKQVCQKIEESLKPKECL